ncbi:hypothetical protein L0Y59_03970 [Candidatus Uhrbacteria bacterium]|nr:hypothetical protein [Candidatus Uhrbacteria bacterium]
MYLQRLTKLSALLHGKGSSRVSLSLVGREPESQSLLFLIQEHLDIVCEKCQRDEQRLAEKSRIPDEEGVLIAKGMRCLRKAFPGMAMHELLRSDTALCKTLRNVVLKYHPDFLAHEIAVLPDAEEEAAIDVALDRLWDPLKDYG